MKFFGHVPPAYSRRPHPMGWARAALPLLALAWMVAGCTTNPATGESSFTAFMSPAEEIRVGAEEHPKILKEYGGQYSDRRVTDYVQRIGQSIAIHTEMPDLHYTFTVLNSPVVNAFALPGGYVYVTRGILALINSEAELAGVLGHELGHVNARHTAQRYSQSVLTGIGASAIGVLTGISGASNLAQQGADLYLASYSRDQERQADELGIRYLRRAGYDTGAMARMLGALLAYEKLQTLLTGKASSQGFLATHPATPERIDNMNALSNKEPPLVANPRIGEADYLFTIDGLIYGSDPNDGVLHGRVFAHKRLNFQFEVPPGFTLLNSATRVTMRHDNGAFIVFDTNPKPYTADLASYIRRAWLPNLDVGYVETIDINGLDAATAGARVNTNEGARDARFVAIRADANKIFRFLIFTPPNQTAALSVDLRRMTYSFRALSAQEAAKITPLRVRAHPVERNETAATIAASMPYPDHQLERFEALNALQAGQALAPGRIVKLIGE